MTQGHLCFNFTAGDGEGCIGAGETRWVRPGYRYDGEYANSEGAHILVLNVVSGPNMRDIPPTDFVSDKHVALNRACDIGTSLASVSAATAPSAARADDARV